MPFTQPHTFVTGDLLSTEDIDENRDALEGFISLGVDAAADLADDSIKARNILRPKHQFTSQYAEQSNFQTGIIAHTRLPALDYTIADPMENVGFSPAGWIAEPYSSSDPGPYAYRPVPGTWTTYYAVKEPRAVVVKYFGEVLIPVDHTTIDTVDNVFCLQHGGPSPTLALESTSRVTNQKTGNPNLDRRHISGCALFVPAAAPATGPRIGWNHVGLVVGLKSNFGLIGSMTVSVEILY